MATDKLDEAQEQSAWSAMTAWKALSHIPEALGLAQNLNGEVSFLRSRVSEVIEACYEAAGAAVEQGRKVKKPEARTGLLKDELNLLKQRKLTCSETKVASHKVADAM